MTEHIETVIVGAGQAGLATSFHLTRLGREHIVLEQAPGPGNAWRAARWDSFTLNTPNWAFRLPGAEYQGQAPDGFMPRAEIVTRFESYAAPLQSSIRFGVCVQSVELEPDGQGYVVHTPEVRWTSRNVVVATGLYQRSKLPAFSRHLSPRLAQVPSGEYRNPAALPDGAVLVVGSGQSGCQIGEELYRSGRKVFLSVGTAGRAPRRYRGKDIFAWLLLIGFFDRTAAQLPSPQARFAGNPQVSGLDGGHNLNLHQFARDGVVLLGRIRSGGETTIGFAADLYENLAKVDKFEADLLQKIDVYIESEGIQAAQEVVPDLRDGYTAEVISDLDLRSAGITSIVWAMGHDFDFNLVRLPAFDSSGFPVQQRGVSEFPGLFFVGLPWLHAQKSGLLYGVGEDAEFIAAAIAARSSPVPESRGSRQAGR